jgi:hypothetical protein
MSDLNNLRDGDGRFRAGNPGGPGRPRRAVESEYLATLSDAVPLRTWKTIVKKAVKDATAGNRHAREWLGNYLIGRADRASLLDLAAKELVGFDSVESRACTFVLQKPMIDAKLRLFLRKTADNSSEQ